MTLPKYTPEAESLTATNCEDLMPGDLGTPQQPSDQPKKVKHAQ